MTPPPGWRMELFQVVPHLLIGTRLASGSEYATLGVDVIVDLEDWEWAWVPPVPMGKMYLCFPMEDEDEVDPKTRDVAQFIASLIRSERTVLVHCTEGLNRSGVVAARALMVMGRTDDEAIRLVRQQRGLTMDGFSALGTEVFVEWLLAEEAGSDANRRAP
jgi:protein-tyrosine phosphatase